MLDYFLSLINMATSFLNFGGSIMPEQANLTMTMFDFSTLITLATAFLNFDGSIMPIQAKLTNNSYHDFVIVGGGTAGCVIAARLAEQNYSVLLLERGSDPNVISYLPGLFFALSGTSSDYDYKSTVDLHNARAQGNQTRVTMGKGLGGSSILNHLLHVHGPAIDYDGWAEITGDDSWSYDNMLPYLKKSESMKDPVLAEKYSKYHGTDGPIGVSRLLSDDEMVQDFLKAQEEAGNPVVEDINSDTTTGYTQPQYTIARDHQNKTGGIRQSTSYSYLNPIKDLTNLHVSTETTVKRIIIEDETAVGVEAIYEGKTYIFKANKEVILSAGTFNTPQILQLSGIGPKEHLESLGIDVIADLPVGDNLRIPSAVVVVTKTKKHLSILPINIADTSAALNPTKLPFPVILGSVAFNKSSKIPNYTGFHLQIPYNTPFELLACPLVYGYNFDICLKWQKQIVSHDSVFSVLVNLEAESTGSVRCHSTDIFDSPVIKTGFYDKPVDLEKMVNIISDFTTIVESPTFAKNGAVVVGLDLEECAEHEQGTKDYWRCYIRNRTISSLLAHGTCAMGSVVDAKLRVIGIKNLLALGAQTFPKAMHCVYNAAVIAQAEKIAADLVTKYGDTA